MRLLHRWKDLSQRVVGASLELNKNIISSLTSKQAEPSQGVSGVPESLRNGLH